ncbi:MAG: type IV secretory system conjugative DNA transfer family protein, partial [Acidimicrobiales bacterium]
MALVVAAGCLGVSWLIWLAGGLLTLMTTGRWQEVPMVQAPVLLVRLISHPNMPLEAWPPLIRRSLPGSGATVAWLVVLAVLAGVTISWLAWHRSDARRARGALGWRPGSGGTSSRSAGARRFRVPVLLDRGAASRSASKARGWAHARDLRPLRVTNASGDRIVLGTHAGRLLAAEPRHSVMVVGPTQSGKTSGLAIPAILEWSGPILATSVKAD